MSDDLFQAPQSADIIDWKPLLGSLLMVKATAFREKVRTKNGEKDAVEADVHVLDGGQAGVCYKGALVFPLVLQSQLKGAIGNGKFTVGRLIQVPSQNGNNPAWKLDEPTDADYALGRRYVASDVYKRNEGQSPQVQAPPQQAQQGAQPVQPTQQPAQSDPWGSAGQQPANVGAPASDPWGSAEPPF